MSSKPDPQAARRPPPQPRSPVAARMWERARREWQQQQFDAAERSLAKVVALAPDDLDAIRMLGVAAQRRGDHATAVGHFRRVLAASPPDSPLCIGIGVSLYELGEVDEALQQLRLACDLAPKSSPAWFNLGKALEKEAYSEEAAAAFRRSLALAPSHLPSRLSLARAQVALGLVDSAVAGFREVLRHAPDNPEAWFGLSTLGTFHFDAAETAHLQRAYARGDLAAEDRELLGSALAKALEDQGDHAQAFDVFGLVKASQRKRVQGNAEGERKRLESIRQAFAGASSAPVDPRQGHEAILIVSLPRSGSTLVEQILASHPMVEGANEIRAMHHVIDGETRRRGAKFPVWVSDTTPDDWHRLGGEYLERTARWRKAKPRFTDKNLLNWYLLGAAMRMLPSMRAVVVRRDPLETCLACYRQYFTASAGFACDLDDMADYCINFLRLMRFWQERFPQQMFELRYESLVAEPEPTIRALLDFCGLPFDQACLEFHKTSRAVLSTPSAAQVREPLRRDTARSALYGDKLDGLRQRLRDAGVLQD